MFIRKSGMLKDQADRSVLKAAVKPICGAREIKFYEDLEKSCNDRVLSELHLYVPEFRGTVKIPFRGKSINFIKLGDITHGMAEPCVIDVKIGKRTWDPQATSDKISAEEQKYAACKQNLGFCIPGFQVYDIQSGRLRRFGKEYGKKLNQSSVKDGEYSERIKLSQMFATNNIARIYKDEIFLFSNPCVRSITYISKRRLSCIEIITQEIFSSTPIHSKMDAITNGVPILFQLIVVGI